MNSGNASALLYAHENAHLVDYDKGEEIAKYAETKIGKNDPNEKFTDSEREEYINSLRERVKIDKTLEEQFEIARNIDKNDREEYSTEFFTSEAYAFGGRVSRTQSIFTLLNKEKETLTTYNIGSTSVGFGSLDMGASAGIGFYYDDTVEDLSKLTTSIGGSLVIGPVSIGTDFLLKKDSKIPRGIRFYVGKGITTPLPVEGHLTFIEIGNPKNIYENKKAYKVFKDFLKSSRERGGEW
ncbi:hypothetical protein [Fusobacterium gastrosuis]|uniref:hypothetical protein n=1 Tax=Fusobacterium gastrosuis TaxID=1755100 RepID=UPI00297308B3|nr:hypothetical protein [Fusobacteriaceae bacterium]MDY5712862.1 hypothetical protein [Fusobacterium gastrosuis]